MAKVRTVCIVTPDLAGPTRNGGIGTHCLYLARLLVRRGHSVTIIHTGPPDTSDLPGWQQEFRDRHGVDLRFLEDLPNTPAVPVMPDSPRHQTAHRLFGWLRYQSFDTIHFQDWQGNGAVCAMAKRTGVAFNGTRLIVTAHGSSEWIREGMGEFPSHARESLIDDALERTAIACADALISPTHYMLEWLRDHGWRLPAEVRVAPYLFEANISPPRALLPGALKEIIFFGRLETRKGIEPFLSAIEQLDAAGFAGPLEVTLIGKHHTTLFGSSAELIAATTSRLSRITVECRTDWDHHQATAYLRGRENALVVTPSVADNAPFAVIECLMFGVPVIASDRGGIPELIGSSEHLVHPSADLLAGRFREIWTHGLMPVTPNYSSLAAIAAWDALEEWSPPVSDSPPARLRISVCVPHFDQPAQLCAVLDALNGQSVRPHEIIVVDDGSQHPKSRDAVDELERKWASKSTRFLRQTNSGPAAARNSAAEHASGDALVFCDADNVPHPTMLESLEQALRSSQADVVTTAFRAVHSPEDTRARDDAGYLFCPLREAGALALVENVLGDTNFMIKREVFRSLGGFNAANRAASEDWEFLLKASLKHVAIAVLPEPQFDYVITTQSHARTQSRLAGARAALGALPQSDRLWLEPLLLATRGAFENREIFVAQSRVDTLEHDLRDVHARLFESRQALEGLQREIEQERQVAANEHLAHSMTTAKLHDSLDALHAAERASASDPDVSTTKGSAGPFRIWDRRLKASAEVDDPAPAAHLVYFIEQPDSWADAPVKGRLTGWILQSDYTPVRGVRAVFHDRTVPARYFLPRPDVAALYGEPARTSGLALEYSQRLGETQPIALDALLSDGRWHRFFERMLTTTDGSGHSPQPTGP